MMGSRIRLLQNGLQTSLNWICVVMVVVTWKMALGSGARSK